VGYSESLDAASQHSVRLSSLWASSNVDEEGLRSQEIQEPERRLKELSGLGIDGLYREADGASVGLKPDELAAVLLQLGVKHNYGLPSGTAATGAQMGAFWRGLQLQDLAVWLNSRHTTEVPPRDTIAHISQAPPTLRTPPNPETKAAPNKAGAGRLPKKARPFAPPTASTSAHEAAPPTLPTPPAISALSAAVRNAPYGQHVQRYTDNERYCRREQGGITLPPRPFSSLRNLGQGHRTKRCGRSGFLALRPDITWYRMFRCRRRTGFPWLTKWTHETRRTRRANVGVLGSGAWYDSRARQSLSSAGHSCRATSSKRLRSVWTCQQSCLDGCRRRT